MLTVFATIREYPTLYALLLEKIIFNASVSPLYAKNVLFFTRFNDSIHVKFSVMHTKGLCNFVAK